MYTVFPNKHLMTGPKLNIEVKGKQNWLFPVGPVIKCYVIPPNLKPQKTEKNVCLMPAGTQICQGFEVNEPITCESKVQVVVSLGRYWVLFAQGSSEFLSMTRDTFSSNQKAHLSWEV